MPSPKELIDLIYSSQNKARILHERTLYMIFNGHVRDSVKEAIEREFLLPETVRELTNRIIPLNITQKVVKKLATVYKEGPRREDKNGNEADTQLMEEWVAAWNLNHKMLQANQYFKLCKHTLLEPFVHKGAPYLRANPAHTYTPFSDDMVRPECPTGYVKHLEFGHQDAQDDRHIVWTDTEHYLMNGKGEIIPMEGNEGNVNPYGILPFVYIKEAEDQLIPISDDDLLRMQIVICLLLTDLAFASKYQAWSIIALINANTEKLSFNPNSVVSLESKNGSDPDIKVVKPQLDSDALLRLIESMLGMLLTTKSLSVGSVTGQVQAAQAASGVAKVLDQAESTEDKETQVMYFEVAEKELFVKLAYSLLPIWASQGVLETDFVSQFSSDFTPAISYPEQKPVLSEETRVNLEISKLNNRLTTRFMAVQSINPDFSTDEVEQVLNEIKQDEINSMDGLLGPGDSLNGAIQPQA